MIDLHETFNKFDGEYLEFDRVTNKMHARPDLCALLLLDSLMPNAGRGMVCAAEHDQIFLDVNCEMLAGVATEDDIITLRRCGVRYDDKTDSLSMFA